MSKDVRAIPFAIAVAAFLGVLPASAHDDERSFPVEVSLEAPDSGNFRGLTTTSG